MMFRKRYLAVVLSSAIAFGTANGAMAQDWPTRPITMVVPFAAGSASDTAGRVLSAELTQVLGQQVIVEDVAGGGGILGTARVAKAPPDGYHRHSTIPSRILLRSVSS